MFSGRYLLILGLAVLVIAIVQSAEAYQGSQATFRNPDQNSNNLHQKVANAPDRRVPLPPARPPGPGKSSANKCPPGRVWSALFRMCRKSLRIKGNSLCFTEISMKFSFRCVLNFFHHSVASIEIKAVIVAFNFFHWAQFFAQTLKCVAGKLNLKTRHK